MDEQARFEPRSVLGPRRSGRSRIGLAVLAVVLVGTAWAGLSGAPPNQSTAGVETSGAPLAPITERPTDPQGPGRVLGLEVMPLGQVEPRQLGRDDVVALSGWYVATAVTSCPPLAKIYQEASLPQIRAADWREFCNRSGVLFAAQPHLTGDQPTGSVEGTPSGNAGVSVVSAWLAIGIVVPPELEVVDLDSTAVVVVGRFVESADACPVVQGCPRELMIDRVAWTAG